MTLPLRSIPGIIAWPVRGELTVRISSEPAPAPTAPVLEQWAKLIRDNPRHYNGPLLSVVTLDLDRGELLCRRDNYQRLAVQPTVPTGVHQLAVTGILTATDGGGRQYALLGRRSHETRIHGGMWELGPSGGVVPPPPNLNTMTTADLIRHLADEVAEEVGLDLPPGHVVALVRELAAFSDDIAIACDLGSLEAVSPRTSAANWEYTEVLWLPLDAVRQFDQANEGEIIGATRALFRVLGWIDES
jgi:hypothetical protein